MIMIDFAWNQLDLAWLLSQISIPTRDTRILTCESLTLFHDAPWRRLEAFCCSRFRLGCGKMLTPVPYDCTAGACCSLEISVDGNLQDFKLRSWDWNLLIRIWKSQLITLLCLSGWIAISQKSELCLQLKPRLISYKTPISGWISVDLC